MAGLKKSGCVEINKETVIKKNGKIMKRIGFIIGLMVLALTQLQAQKLTKDNIDEIVKALTLEEKARILVGSRNEMFGGGAAIGATQALVPGAAGTTQAAERLGVTRAVLSDGPAGLRINPTRPNDTNTYYATGFPVGTCLASSWNTELVANVGKAMGNEVLEYGADVLLAPGMNIHRNPLCGRNFEYFSEDPVVAGKIAAAYVSGVQSNGVGTSIKHFAANSQETNRTGNDARVSQRALREIYLKGFEIAVKESNPWTVMSSYNKLNGSFTQESYDLLTTILRDEWGFKGIVMTDWIGQRNTAAQVHAGNDLMEPGQPVQSEEIVAKVKSGELKEADVDACVKRMLEFIVKTPRFSGYKYSNKPDLKEHATVTRQSATEGMVLLKNENKTLPIASEIKNIALFGITSYDFVAGGTGSGDVNKAYVVDLMEGLSNAGYSVQKDIKELYEKYKAYQNAKISSEQTRSWFMGKPTLPEMPVAKSFIEKNAKVSEIAIVTIGRNAGEGRDRKIPDDFNISNDERILLNDVCDAFHAEGKKVIVILNIGGVIETASWKNLPDAILCAWQPGQEGGNSVADVLKGTANPSGKLTMTFPISCMDHPSSLNFPTNYTGTTTGGGLGNSRTAQQNVDYTLYNEDIYVGYRYFKSAEKAVSYPFGFGLSYTTFACSSARITPSGNDFIATVSVKNTGNVAGKQVVELYISAPAGKLEKPTCELKAFAKTKELAPGESQIITMKFTNYDLASYDEDSQSWVTDAGIYNAKFGTSVDDVFATVNFNAKALVIKAHDALKPAEKINRLSLR